MLSRFKQWHTGLSKNGKRVFASAAVVSAISLGTVAAQPSPDTPAPTTQQTPKPTAKTPVVEKKTTTETAVIPFEKTTINDPSITQGATAHRTAGVNGVKTFTYELTITDGVQTDKKLVSEAATTPPVTDVVAIGTKAIPPPPPVSRSNCDSNYSGCVPIASDVDCAGGSGNGPAYAQGPVSVIGSDIYGLDRDGDGLACE